MLSIPEKASQIVENILSQEDDDNSRTMFIVGSKSVGKSTLLYSFLERTETPRETLLLEYSFGRKSNHKQGLDKILCHIWEFGGKLDMLKSILPSIPCTGKFFYCIMVDLSKVKYIWDTTEICFQGLQGTEYLIEPIIICGKYDVFKNYDTEVKKCVCTTMRSLALLHNAHLLYYSTKDPHLVKRAKEMLNNIGFGRGVPFKEKTTSFTKPLFISKGADSWENIGVLSSSLEEVKLRHISKIPSASSGSESSNGTTRPSQKHSHPEPYLDSLISLKYDEIRRIGSIDMSTDDYLLNINK